MSKRRAVISLAAAQAELFQARHLVAIGHTQVIEEMIKQLEEMIREISGLSQENKT